EHDERLVARLLEHAHPVLTPASHQRDVEDLALGDRYDAGVPPRAYLLEAVGHLLVADPDQLHRLLVGGVGARQVEGAVLRARADEGERRETGPGGPATRTGR